MRSTVINCGPDGAVGIANDYGLDGLGSNPSVLTSRQAESLSVRVVVFTMRSAVKVLEVLTSAV